MALEAALWKERASQGIHPGFHLRTSKSAQEDDSDLVDKSEHPSQSV